MLTLLLQTPSRKLGNILAKQQTIKKTNERRVDIVDVESNVDVQNAIWMLDKILAMLKCSYRTCLLLHNGLFTFIRSIEVK